MKREISFQENSLSAEKIASAGFQTVRKGYSPNEVRAFLLRVGGRISQLEASIERLTEELDAERLKSDNRESAPLPQSQPEQGTEQASEIIRIASDTARAIRVQAESQVEALIDRAQKAARRITEETSVRVDDQLNEAELSAQDLIVRARRQVDDMLRRADVQAEEILQRAKEEGRHILVRAKEQRAGLIEEARIKVELLEREISDLETARNSVLSVLTGASEMIQRAERGLDPDQSRRKAMSSVEEALGFLNHGTSIPNGDGEIVEDSPFMDMVVAASSTEDLAISDSDTDVLISEGEFFDVDTSTFEDLTTSIAAETDSEEPIASEDESEGFRILSVGTANIEVIEPDNGESAGYLDRVTALVAAAKESDDELLQGTLQEDETVADPSEDDTNAEGSISTLMSDSGVEVDDNEVAASQVVHAEAEQLIDLSSTEPSIIEPKRSRVPASEKPRLTFPSAAKVSPGQSEQHTRVKAGRRNSTASSSDTGSSGIPAETTGPGPDEDSVRMARLEGLFEKMKISREVDELEAQEVLSKFKSVGQIDAIAEIEPSELAQMPRDGFEGESVRLGQADLDLIAARDSVLAPSISKLARRIKRQLQDEQNEILDSLRKGGRDGALSLVSRLAEAKQEHADALLPMFEVAVGAGFNSTGKDEPDAELLIQLSQLSALELQELVDQLSLMKVRAAVTQAGVDSETDQIAAITIIYRELRSGRVDTLVEDSLVAAFSLAALKGAERHQVRWISYDMGTPCPDCEDNALAGAVMAGEPFPTSHLSPLVHSGCRCLLAVVGA